MQRIISALKKPILKKKPKWQLIIQKRTCVVDIWEKHAYMGYAYTWNQLYNMLLSEWHKCFVSDLSISSLRMGLSCWFSLTLAAQSAILLGRIYRSFLQLKFTYRLYSWFRDVQRWLVISWLLDFSICACFGATVILFQLSFKVPYIGS